MASHSTTGEWKTFELRMRHRRVERLLLRAEAAADAGDRDAARACLEELQRLMPGLPAIETLRERLTRPAASAPAISTFRRAPWGISTAIVAIAVFIWYRPSPLPSEDLRALPVSMPVARMAGLPVTPTVVHASLPAVLPISSPVVSEERIRPVQPLEEDPPLTRRAGPSLAEFLLKAHASRGEDARAVDTRPQETPPRGDGPDAAAPANDVAAVAKAGVTPPAVPSAPRADVAVRRTLDRYAAAYNELDAAAAQRVWPTVDRAALARAFDALASQRVSLGDCRIEIASATARADCAGSATWSARIGDGSSRTEARRWTFDLERAGDEWQIVSARAQNR